MTLRETVNRVADLSRRMQAYYEVEYPKKYPNYPLINPYEEEYVPPPSEEAELETFLSRLSEERLRELLLVMYLGRGDFGFGSVDFPAQVQKLRESFSTVEEVTAEMSGAASPVRDYALDGLAMLDQLGIDPESLLTAQVAA